LGTPNIQNRWTLGGIKSDRIGSDRIGSDRIEQMGMGLVPPLAPLVAAGQGGGQGGVMTSVPVGELALPGSMMAAGGVKLDMKQLMSWVRHSKNGKLKVRRPRWRRRLFYLNYSPAFRHPILMMMMMVVTYTCAYHTCVYT
jgi:hypothetical protein